MPNQLHKPHLVLPVSEERDHILGPSAAPVTVLEYGDYECPHCQQAHFVLQELLEEVSDVVRLALRNFPLSQIHPHAQRAAEAAEAAGAQGKFWEMHDTLFENQEALEDEDLVAYAEELRLDLDRFQMEIIRATYVDRIRQDFLGGVRSGVNGTPTFFINGIRHDGPWDVQSLMDAMADSIGPRTRKGRSRTR